MRSRIIEHPGIPRLGAVALIGMYLAAIVIANLTVAWFGVGMVIPNAFLFIGLDLTARDKLHEAWRGRGLAWKMGLLIMSGSALSAALDWAAIPVAVASCTAFAIAAVTDTLIYSALHGRRWLIRSNGSNVVSALVDSAVFLSVLAAYGLLPWIAFPLLVSGQWAAKAIGGLAWSLLLEPRRAGWGTG